MTLISLPGGEGPGGEGGGKGPGEGPGPSQLHSEGGQLGGLWLQFELHQSSVAAGEMAWHWFCDTPNAGKELRIKSLPRTIRTASLPRTLR